QLRFGRRRYPNRSWRRWRWWSRSWYSRSHYSAHSAAEDAGRLSGIVCACARGAAPSGRVTRTFRGRKSLNLLTSNRVERIRHRKDSRGGRNRYLGGLASDLEFEIGAGLLTLLALLLLALRA